MSVGNDVIFVGGIGIQQLQDLEWRLGAARLLLPRARSRRRQLVGVENKENVSHQSLNNVAVADPALDETIEAPARTGGSGDETTRGKCK